MANSANPVTPEPRRSSIAWPRLLWIAVAIVAVGAGGFGPTIVLQSIRRERWDNKRPIAQSEVIAVYSIEGSEPVNLVEMRFRGLDGAFDLSEITQAVPGEPRSNWQVPYMEHILNSAGDAVLADDSIAAKRSDLWKGEMRMVFFFHYLDLQQPLKTPFGDVRLPAQTALPDRLSMITYEPP
jgi:hypothetical protein